MPHRLAAAESSIGVKYAFNAHREHDTMSRVSNFMSGAADGGLPPEENWLPLVRGDYSIDIIMRFYAPDLERFKTWDAPKAEIVE